MTIDPDLDSLLQGRKLLIFDFDGTVADTSPLHTQAFATTLAPLGIQVDYSQIAGMRTREAMQYCLDKAGVKASEKVLLGLIEAKQLAVREMMPTRLKAISGIDDFLRWARSRFAMAMATSGSRETVSLALGILGYSDWFDPLICAEEVSKAKPDPECFLKILSCVGLKKEEVLIFEDSLHGFLAATNAGLEYVDIRSLKPPPIKKSLK